MFVKITRPKMWWYRHAWQCFVFILALNTALFQDVALDSQVTSSIIGLLSSAVMICILWYSPYLRGLRWMAWCRLLILCQIVMTYALKLIGCPCSYKDPETQVPLTFLQILSHVWLVLYVATPFCLVASFTWCVLHSIQIRNFLTNTENTEDIEPLAETQVVFAPTNLMLSMDFSNDTTLSMPKRSSPKFAPTKVSPPRLKLRNKPIKKEYNQRMIRDFEMLEMHPVQDTTITNEGNAMKVSTGGTGDTTVGTENHVSQAHHHRSTSSFQRHVTDHGHEYFEALDGPLRGQTMWEVPPGDVVINSTAASRTPVGSVDIHVDEATGRKYSINAQTGGSEWLDKTVEEAVHVDPATGRRYNSKGWL